MPLGGVRVPQLLRPRGRDLFWGLGFGVWGLGSGIWGLGFGLWGWGLGVGVGVWGLEFGVSHVKLHFIPILVLGMPPDGVEGVGVTFQS